MLFIQLGNLIFKEAFTPESFSYSDETTYAEHALIGLKPRLQPTANNLEEIEMAIRLRSEFVDVDITYKAIKQSKDTFEVLPLIKGDGNYIGDFVITKMSYSPVFMLPDGKTIDKVLSITLREYQAADKLQQQQAAARKSAFAVGNVQPVKLTPPTYQSQPRAVMIDVAKAKSHTALIDTQVRNYQSNASQQVTLSAKIADGIASINKNLDSAQSRLDELSSKYDVAAIVSGIGTVKNVATQFTFPPASPGVLADNNRDLQAAINNLSKIAMPFGSLVISRTI